VNILRKWKKGCLLDADRRTAEGGDHSHEAAPDIETFERGRDENDEQSSRREPSKCLESPCKQQHGHNEQQNRRFVKTEAQCEPGTKQVLAIVFAQGKSNRKESYRGELTVSRGIADEREIRVCQS